jgi:hypothetical protein
MVNNTCNTVRFEVLRGDNKNSNLLANSSKDGDTKRLQNVATYMPVYMTPCSKDWNLHSNVAQQSTTQNLQMNTRLQCTNLSLVDQI